MSPMKVAMAFSILLHLSMVTLFNVVIYFPRNDLPYYTFTIQEVPAIFTAASTPSGARLRSPSLDDALATALGEPVPDVQLPTIEFAELSRLSIGRESLDTDLAALLDDSPKGSWAVFGESLRGFGRRISSLATGGGFQDGSKPRPAHRPAEGYEAFVEWDTPPAKRELLFAPPISALYDAPSGEVFRPIELVIEVDREGRVVNVFSPNVDAGGLTDAVQMAVLKYRFAPLTSDGAPERHMGTLLIRAAGGGT